MKNIRLFLQFCIFLVVVGGAVVLAPHLGLNLDKPVETGLLSAPDIPHGHGAGHDEHGAAHAGAEEGHGDAATAEHAEAEHVAVAEGEHMAEDEAAAAEEGEAMAEEAVAEGEAVAEEAATEEAAIEEAVAEEAVVEEAVAEEAAAEEAVVEEAVAEEAATEEAVVEEVVEEAAAEEPVAEPEPEPAAVEEPAAAAPADLTINPIDPATAKQAPVAFSHASHEATDCAFCHHKGGNTSCASAGCHTDTSTKKITPGQAENVSFEAAFHLKGDKSCVGCHKAQGAGPTKCTDCHPK